MLTMSPKEFVPGITTQKINYLEGVRGIAAFMVLAHHFMLAFYPAAYDSNHERMHTAHLEGWYYSSPLNVLTNGNFCVTIFFVLSGYVLSQKYVREGNITIVFSAATRRFFRLFIPVGTVIIISFLLIHYGLLKHVEASKITKSDWWLGTLWPVPGTFGWFFEFFTYRVMFLGDSNCDTSMWTMSMELFGSFLVFGILALTHILKRRDLLCIAAIVILFLAQKYYYLAFPFGIMMNSVEKFSLSNKNPVIGYVLVPVLIFGGLLLGSYPSLNFAHYGFWEFIYNFKDGQKFLDTFAYVAIHVAGSVMVVAGIVLSPTLQKIMSMRLFVFLGLISFSLYLLHPLVIGAFSSPLMLSLIKNMTYNKAALTVFISTIALTVILSWVMAVTVDRFSVNFSKKYLGFKERKMSKKELKKKKNS